MTVHAPDEACALVLSDGTGSVYDFTHERFGAAVDGINRVRDFFNWTFGR